MTTSKAVTPHQLRLRVALLLAALLLLDVMLTFHNVWPTLRVHWTGELSVEFAGILVLLTAWRRLCGPVPPQLLKGLAALFVIGALSRYGEVTVQGLYGREVNLYWDVPNLSSVAQMLTRVASLWLIVAMTVGAALALTLLYLTSLWSIRRIAFELDDLKINAVVGIVAIAMIGWFALQRLDDRLPRVPQFSIPVGKAYVDQVVRLTAAISGRGAVRDLPPSPELASTLSQIDGSDVMVVFVESYGRVVYDRAEFFQTLGDARQELDAAVHDTGREMVSGFVDSPTFGGGSWLAHISLLTGIDIRDAGVGQLLMTQSRRTLGSEMARHGYRRIALMPGLKNNWPEGAFYGFDKIYDDPALGYSGPAFGWWRIPDQFTLAQFDALETNRPSRQPLFSFYPTVSTHTPFRPTPPYQANWSRVLSNAPYDTAALHQSLVQSPEWNNMGTSYVGAVDYSLRTLAGYLRARASQNPNPNLILVILGDHQPPAMVSGENASWDVPVHVISSNPTVLAALRTCGFVAGSVPATQTLGHMHRLGSALLAAFEAPSPSLCSLK